MSRSVFSNEYRFENTDRVLIYLFINIKLSKSSLRDAKSVAGLKRDILLDLSFLLSKGWQKSFDTALPTSCHGSCRLGRLLISS